MNIDFFGKDERVRSAAERLSCEKLEYDGELRILPIPSSRDGEHVTGTELSFVELVESLPRKSLVIGYDIPEKLCLLLREKRIKYFDAAQDEEFLVKNADITAIAALGYVLNSSDKTPYDMSFGIIGYGRIGKALLRLLLFLGASVRVFTGKAVNEIELGRLGIRAESIDAMSFDEKSGDNPDVIFNTAPINLSGLFPKKRTPPGMRVLELASGDSFPGVAGVEYLPSLPARVFPKSAGAAYSDFAIRAIRKETE